MRYAAFVAAALMLIQPAYAEKTPEVDPRASLGVVQQWIYGYRAKPDYAHVPAAVRVLFHSQTFKEPENAGIYLGFVAGAIGSNPAKAEQLIASFFPVRPEDEWVIVRAIAYSGLPDWRNILRRVAPRMPGRRVMIDSYLAGKLPTLTDIPLEEMKPGVMDKLRGAFTKNPFAKDERKLNTTLTFASNQDLLDTLWGYYFATGSHAPIQRIIQMLPWSKSRETVDKLTVGSMARYTLASYAIRDASLREYLRSELARQPAGSRRRSRKWSRRRTPCRLQPCARMRSPPWMNSRSRAPIAAATSASGDRWVSARSRSVASLRLRWGRSRSASPA